MKKIFQNCKYICCSLCSQTCQSCLLWENWYLPLSREILVGNGLVWAGDWFWLSLAQYEVSGYKRDKNTNESLHSAGISNVLICESVSAGTFQNMVIVRLTMRGQSDKETNTAIIIKLIYNTDSMLFERTPSGKLTKSFMISTGGEKSIVKLRIAGSQFVPGVLKPCDLLIISYFEGYSKILKSRVWCREQMSVQLHTLSETTGLSWLAGPGSKWVSRELKTYKDRWSGPFDWQ